jgi:hypothetical protein
VTGRCHHRRPPRPLLQALFVLALVVVAHGYGQLAGVAHGYADATTNTSQCLEEQP